MQNTKQEQIIILSRAISAGNMEETIKILNALTLELFTEEEINNIGLNFLVKYLAHSFEVLPERFKTLKVCNYALNRTVANVKYLPKKYQTLNTYNALIKKDIMTLIYMPKEYQTKELWLELLAKNPTYLNFVPEEFKTVEFLKDYAIMHPNTFINVIPRECLTMEFWKLCMNSNMNCLEHMPKELWLEYVVKHPYYFDNVPENIKTNEFVRDFALRTSTAFVKYIPEKYKTGEFYLSLLNVTPRYMHLIPRSFLKNK